MLVSDGHPLLVSLLEELDRVDAIEPVVIIDAKAFTEKDSRLFAERTSGAFPQPRKHVAAGRLHVTVESHNDPGLRDWLAANGVSLLANGGTPRRIGSELLDAVPIVNAHPGLLPKYRGASCCEWALHNGDPVGVSVHFMDTELDRGPIIRSEELAIDPSWRYVDIRVALYRLAQAAMARGLGDVVERQLTPASLPPQPQDGEVFKPMPVDVFDALRARIDSR